MAIESAVATALITAACGVCLAVIARLRCRFIADKGWSCAVGFSEYRLPSPR